VVLGLFTWSDQSAYAHREIDVEVSRWGKPSDTNNAQFVVQPYQLPSHILRFAVSPDTTNVTYMFTWKSNRVDFLALNGHAKSSSGATSVICQWMFKKRDVPQPGDQNARINLWLLGGMAPKASNDTEVVISKFEFDPEPAETSVPPAMPEVSILTLPPPSLKPGPVGTGRIAGTASGIKPIECKVVVYAYGDRWYVQPMTVDCDTIIGADGKWATSTHGGLEYAALLVKAGYAAAPTLAILPSVGGDVLVVARAKPKD
jgi:hypothetical protein